MSIKKLFGSTDSSIDYVAETDDKNLYKDVESEKNIKAIKRRQETYVPQIDYKEPANFARYGSAYLYYKSAIEWIHDYYPYDGSDGEINEYTNGLLDIEKYIFDNLYPRTNGYIIISNIDDGGWGTLNGSLTDGYGLPNTLEYITLKGGPGTGSLSDTSLVGLSPNDYNNKFQNSNIYDEDIYTTAGLPTTYGSGSRESNIKADFDNGVTVEFWLKTGSAPLVSPATAPLANLTEKQVIFDWWNQESVATSEHYGRIMIELTSSKDAAGDPISPFLVTIQSGTAEGGRDVFVLGSSSLHQDFGNWHHYAITMYNTGSGVRTELYVDGNIKDTTAKPAAYALSSSFTMHVNKGDACAKTYSSHGSLQGWWRLNENYNDSDAYIDVSDESNPSRIPLAFITALSKTAGQANTRKLKIYDHSGAYVDFTIDNSIMTSTATNIAFGNANSNATQFATNIAAAVNAAESAGTLAVTASSSGAIVTLSATHYTVPSDMTGTAITDSVVTITDQFRNRDGKFDATDDRPTRTVLTLPSVYIQGERASTTFDGSADKINIGSAPLWDSIIGTTSEKTMTFAAWVRQTAANNSNVLSFGGTTAGGDGEINFRITNTGRIQFYVGWSDGPASWVTTETDLLATNTWYHIALSYDASNTSSDPVMYIDGESVAVSESGAPSGTYLGIKTDNCYIGAAKGASQPFTGQLGDVAVWDSILSADEIKAIYYAVNFYNKHYTFSELNSKNAMARLFATQTGSADSTTGTTAARSHHCTALASGGSWSGRGKLSGSVDEFRFWKVARTPKEIGENWHKHIRGGVNTDISNTTLGVYYKFNEGITGDSDVDSVVLDYSGRITNGVWTGYASNARSTDSAIVSAGAAVEEYKDPIIYSTHSDVVTLKSDLLESGSWHDRQNNSAFVNMIPSWIIEEDENSLLPETTDLKKISHIVGTYFDKLYLQISAFSTFKHQNYTSASHKPLPFARHLPQHLGLYSPEIFVDSTIVEKFLNRNLTGSFQEDLTETKNLIYLNLYNNLANIYKSKGTEKAIRNVFRCFGVDDNLIKLNIYSHNNVYELLHSKKQQLLINKKTLNQNEPGNTSGVVYQKAYTGSAYSAAPFDAIPGDTSGYISGSWGASAVEISNLTIGTNVYMGHNSLHGLEDIYGFTMESEITFPRYNFLNDQVDRTFLSCSLFGLHTVATGSAAIKNGAYTSWITNLGSDSGGDDANFQVWAIRPEPKSRDVYFRITSSNEPYPFPELTSSVFKNVYNDSQWNFSVRLKPDNYPFAGAVSGSVITSYELVFKGINTYLGSVQNSFELTASITGSGDDTASSLKPSDLGANFLRAAKRVYAGARRTNITGAVLQQSDALINSVRYWAKYIDDGALFQHSNDVSNVGLSGSYKNTSPIDFNSANTASATMNSNMLALNWNFNNLTSSDSNGNFFVCDASSGSAQIRDYQGWLGSLAGYQHVGYGYGYSASSDSVMERRSANSYKFIDPERVVSSDMINILKNDDILFKINDSVPSFYYTFEKSMYAAISEEMLDFFAGVVDFNNVIGEPVNRYRDRYKSLEKLREIFFRRVTETSNVEKFINYYKWFDNALSSIVGQLIPASSDFEENIFNTIESHVLERNKYQTKFPTIEFKEHDLDAAMKGWTGAQEAGLGATSPVATSPRPTKKHKHFWQRLADRKATEITSNTASVDYQRNNIKDISWSNPTLSSSIKVKYTTTGVGYTSSVYSLRSRSKLYNISAPQLLGTASAIHGGVNFGNNKNIDFTYNALRPAGPVNNDGSVFIPLNVLLAYTQDLVPLEETHQWQIDTNAPLKKTKRSFKVVHGRNYEYDGTGYSNIKSTFVFPFNIISSSVTTGYNKAVVERVTGGIEIVNLHHDTYGDTFEVPMQGPFTEHTVGGHQSRHVPLNTGSSPDQWYNRPEAWKLLLGTTDLDDDSTSITGAIGMTGPDYPWPEANEVGILPYPMTASQKAWLYRDFVAKRPVNIKNIHSTTSSVLGNYSKKYQVVHSVGAFSNPKGFVQNQPSLPSEIQLAHSSSATQTRTFLDIRRNSGSHYVNISDFSVHYLTSSNNKAIITGRFSAPGGIETMGVGYRDYRGSEYSVYSSVNYRNLTVKKLSQGPSGSFSELDGTPGSAIEMWPSGTTAIRVSDIHNKDFGLQAHLARHSARFGRDSLFVTTSINLPGASYDQMPGFHKVNRNTLYRLKITNDGDLFAPKTVLTATASVNDNFYISHPIPRSDRQYSWISASITGSRIETFGYAPMFGQVAGYYSSSTDGYVPFFNFVSASSVVPFITQSLWQPGSSRLNILTVDSLTASGEDNTLGFALTDVGSSYINQTIMDKFQIENFLTKSANYFNLLMTRRGNKFGWNWTSTRQQDHPILSNEMKSGTLSIANIQLNTIKTYQMPPVSMRGRTALMNFTSAGANITIEATHNNERIYFNTTELDDVARVGTQEIPTPFEHSLLAVRSMGSSLNWIMYSENVFPAARNEFLSASRQRLNYDNKYWRDSIDKRVELGNTIKNSFGVNRPMVSQSSWPLDAQANFLSRSGVPNLSTDDHANFRVGSAGELQNNYMMYHSGVAKSNPIVPQGLAPGALYSRKHAITSPRSVVSPTGIVINETGTINPGAYAPEFEVGSQIDVFGGEAKWEAHTQAGIVIISEGESTYQASASAPWWNSYDDYRQELKLIAKDHVIVPEFRISEHVDDYVKYGLFNRGKFDTFEIAGTNINSSTSSFYKDYSNSEFLRDFLNIKSDSLLDAAEIRLVCSAAIRPVFYKGFYPAQRAIDIVSRFSSSYGAGLDASVELASSTKRRSGEDLIQNEGALLRPLISTLFAPGVLFNSIKSGIAVEYPSVTDPTKLSASYYGAAKPDETDNWAITPSLPPSSTAVGYRGAEFFDVKVPFEAILAPEKYIEGVQFIDMEPHPYVQLNATASMGGASDELYSMMMSNFLGESAKFFLENETYTKMTSETVTSDLLFSSGSAYGMRIKLRRSISGSRDYTRESGSNGNNSTYGLVGGKIYDGSNFGKSSYPVPQDPRQSDILRETITMYSRPTAFGPAIAGRPDGTGSIAAPVKKSKPIDSFSGFNPAYTPPYYNGEAWVDLIFFPDTNTYDLERILSEVSAAYWRFDPGPATGSAGYLGENPVLISSFGSASFTNADNYIYSGHNINSNSMQISASLNLFGIQRVLQEEEDSFGKKLKKTNITAGKKWVIQPKFETPILDFGDKGVHAISASLGTLSMPTFASGSVPRGMWHQFGVMPDSPSKGIFMEITDIPHETLQNHYDVIVNDTIYNNGNASGIGRYLTMNMKSLADVVGFNRGSRSKRLGEIASSRTIKEAIVAVPYTIGGVSLTPTPAKSTGPFASSVKKFINIPQERVDAALSSDEVDLDAAGESVHKLLQKMDRYVLPPQFDFLNTKGVNPIVMYIFEFEYKLDQDDLSYIWQNLAPRDYKKMSLEYQSVAHELMDTELLSENIIMDNENLRWMVFKVKQRSQSNYYDHIVSQVGASSTDIFSFDDDTGGYKIGYNWPYDYMSFVELVKMDVEVLYKQPELEAPATNLSDIDFSAPASSTSPASILSGVEKTRASRTASRTRTALNLSPTSKKSTRKTTTKSSSRKLSKTMSRTTKSNGNTSKTSTTTKKSSPSGKGGY